MYFLTLSRTDPDENLHRVKLHIWIRFRFSWLCFYSFTNPYYCPNFGQAVTVIGENCFQFFCRASDAVGFQFCRRTDKFYHSSKYIYGTHCGVSGYSWADFADCSANNRYIVYTLRFS